MRTITIADLHRGVSDFLGDPVANPTDLPTSDSPAGTMHVKADKQITYLCNGSGWLALGSADGLLVTVDADAECSADPLVPTTVRRYESGADPVLAKKNPLPFE